MELTVKQTFLAMFFLLDAYYDNGYGGDLGGLLGSINPHLFVGDMPADPAAFDDWKACISEVNDNRINPDVAYKAIIQFLEFYSREFGFNFKDVIHDVIEHKIGNDNVDRIWNESLEKVLENGKGDLLPEK